MSTKDLRRILPGLLVSTVLLVVVFSFVDFDFQKILDSLLTANPMFVLMGILCLFFGLISRTFSWRTLLVEQASFSRVFFTLNEGYLLNNVLPFRLGEIARALILSGTTAIGFWQVLSTIVIERAFDLILAAGILFATIPFVFQVPWATQSVVAVFAAVSVVMLALYILARHRDRALGIYGNASERWPFLLRIGQDRVESFFNGLYALTDARRFFKAFGWMAAVWGLTLLQFYFVLRAFIPEAEFAWAAFSLGVLAAGVTLPGLPSSLGIYEASIVIALEANGVSSAPALAYALTTHFLFVFITGVIGLYALLRDGWSISRIYRQARSKMEEEPAVDGL